MVEFFFEVLGHVIRLGLIAGLTNGFSEGLEGAFFRVQAPELD